MAKNKELFELKPFVPHRVEKDRRRGRWVNVDLDNEPGLKQAFHDLKDEFGLNSQELLLQMVRHCVKTRKE